jgi:uncharacterized protein YodC (DUF2158 family)
MHYNVGDVVQLKSGGPVMTVESRYDDEKVNCVWFDSKHVEKRGTFPDAALDTASTEPLGPVFV